MSTKKKLLIFLAVYLVIAGVVVALYKSPGYSSAYMKSPYKVEGVENTAYQAYLKTIHAPHMHERTTQQVHDHYLEIIKSDAYKHWEQRPIDEVIRKEYERRPHMQPSYDRLMAGIKFVEEYESRPEFKAEKARMGTYDLFFSFFNAIALLILAVWFGWKPVRNLLDEQAEGVQIRIEGAESARSEAEKRRKQAETKLAELEAEKAEITRQNEALAEMEKTKVEELTANALAQIDAETEERKRMEQQHAAVQVRQELVEQAISRMTETLKREANEERQAAFVKYFVSELDAAPDNQEAARG